MDHAINVPTKISFTPWNNGKLVGQKSPLRLRDIWAIRVRLQLPKKTRDLALFNLAIDSKLRGYDLVNLRVRDIAHGACISSRVIVMQKKTHRPVQFEITEQTRMLIYRRTKNLRAVQLLLGHTKLESTVRYLGIEVDDALEMAEQTEV